MTLKTNGVAHFETLSSYADDTFPRKMTDRRGVEHTVSAGMWHTILAMVEQHGHVASVNDLEDHPTIADATARVVSYGYVIDYMSKARRAQFANATKVATARERIQAARAVKEAQKDRQRATTRRNVAIKADDALACVVKALVADTPPDAAKLKELFNACNSVASSLRSMLVQQQRKEDYTNAL